MILVQALLDAANTFPRDTGLGWDQVHPRTLNRLSHGILLWICAVLHNAEVTGRWPEAAELVLIALLHKAEGGFRAIGLLPFLPRLWMRTRKNVAAEWEASMQKPYLYMPARRWGPLWRRGSKASEVSWQLKLGER